MGTRPASPEELEAVRAVAAEFREHWERHGPLFPCSFEGAPDDLDALDYLDYEIGLPRSDLWGAALIWGGVLVANGPFRWILDDLGGYILGTLDDPPVFIWPFARLSEATGNDRYRRVLEEIVCHCLARRSLLESDEDRLIQLLRPCDAEDLIRRIESASDRLRGRFGISARPSDLRRKRPRSGR
jgi:hypothetical protein